jgi:hypothetical protein
MKKNFKLTNPKIAPERQVDAVKHEIKKYLTRERNKKTTEGVDFWDFDCKFGGDDQSTEVIQVSEINKSIDGQVASKKESFYLEILAKAGHKTARPKK